MVPGHRRFVVVILLALTVAVFIQQSAANASFAWVDLGTLGGSGFTDNHHGSAAYAINNSGQVAGYARAADGSIHGYLWTPGATDGFPDNAQMRDLGAADWVSALNNHGQVAGGYLISGNDRAFLWTRGETGGLPGDPEMRDLGTLGGTATDPGFVLAFARGINDAGQVVGVSRTGPTHEGSHAFLWTRGGTGGVTSNPQMEDLGTLGHEGGLAGDTFGSDAFDINDRGEIVGYSLTVPYAGHAFLWTRDGTEGPPGNPRMKDLGTLGGGWSYATAINDLGDVVGYSEMPSGSWHAFLWRRGATDGPPSNPQMKDLGTLAGYDSYAMAVSGDTIVGYSYVVTGYEEYQRYVFDPDLNDWVLITVSYPIFTMRGFRYTPSTGMVDIGSPTGSASSGVIAYGINALGQIAATAMTQPDDYEHSTHGVVANPQPQTPPGNNIAVEPVDPVTGATPMTINFENVLTGGDTSVTTSSSGPPPPSGFKAGSPPTYFELETTATFSGSARVCIDYSGLSFNSPSKLKLFHLENGVWIDRTSSIDPDTHTICATVTSFSPFAVFENAFDFSGFLPPIDNAPIRNGVKAGSAVPIKFRLGGNHGLAIFAPGYPRFQRTACDEAAATTLVDETADATGNGLTYDAAADQYQYVWKTNKAWAGLCGTLQLRLIDGSQHSALFEFRK